MKNTKIIVPIVFVLITALGITSCTKEQENLKGKEEKIILKYSPELIDSLRIYYAKAVFKKLEDVTYDASTNTFHADPMKVSADTLLVYFRSYNQ